MNTSNTVNSNAIPTVHPVSKGKAVFISRDIENRFQSDIKEYNNNLYAQYIRSKNRR